MQAHKLGQQGLQEVRLAELLCVELNMGEQPDTRALTEARVRGQPRLYQSEPC